jgi:hypothetical protein
MTTNLTDLTTGQLNSIIAIKERIEKLQSQIDSIAADGEIPIPSTEKAPAPARRKYHMSAAHRRKLIKALAKARKIRWAKIKGTGAKPSKPAKKGKRRLSAAHKAKPAAKKKDRRSSPAVRAKIAAAALLARVAGGPDDADQGQWPPSSRRGSLGSASQLT